MKAPSMKPPSWRKLIASSAALFLVIGAFLSARVNAGTDPALKKSQTSNTTQTTQTAKAKTTQTQTQTQTQATTGSGYDTGTGTGGTGTTNSSGSSQQASPTTTHAS